MVRNIRLLTMANTKSSLFRGSLFRSLMYLNFCKILTFQLRLVNHSVPQNSNGDAAYLKALEVAQLILPNGPVAVKMAKAAINKGMQVQTKAFVMGTSINVTSFT